MSCSWSLVSWVTQLRNSCSQLMIWASCQRREDLQNKTKPRDKAYCHYTDLRSAQTHRRFTVPLCQDQTADVSAARSLQSLPANNKSGNLNGLNFWTGENTHTTLRHRSPVSVWLTFPTHCLQTWPSSWEECSESPDRPPPCLTALVETARANSWRGRHAALSCFCPVRSLTVESLR